MTMIRNLLARMARWLAEDDRLFAWLGVMAIIVSAACMVLIVDAALDALEYEALLRGW